MVIFTGLLFVTSFTVISKASDDFETSVCDLSSTNIEMGEFFAQLRAGAG
jgi:hypothetical protein